MALSFQGHFHHDIAREWFESLDDRDDARLCFCRITQLSFLRLITTEAVMGKDEALSQRQAWDVFDRWLEDSRVFFLEEPPNLDKVFRGISKQTRPAAKHWADSYLLAFAEAADLSVVTFDRAIKQKSGSVLLLQ
jgi:toxin-antitoxin system PIN domain toxin